MSGDSAMLCHHCCDESHWTGGNDSFDDDADDRNRVWVVLDENCSEH